MTLAGEYQRRFQGRDWARAFATLPPLAGKTVLDLGCGVGDLAAELVARGARVIGLDTNEEFLEAARARGLTNAEFRIADLREPLNLAAPVDGIWSSFLPAFFPDLTSALARWTAHLRPGGWIAVTEIENLFGHEPVGARTREQLDAYARDALTAGRYDFHMGRKLRESLERAGFAVVSELTLADQELAFDGPARPGVLDAWRNRLDRMKLLQDFCGADFERLRDEFLGCLTHADHRGVAKVRFCVAIH